MVQDNLSWFQLKTKRLLWLIGITCAVILTFQYLELPYGNLLLSVFSSDKIPTSENSRFQVADAPKSESFKNVTILNKANSTEKANNTGMSEEKDTITRTGLVSEPGRVSNRSLEFDESDGISMMDNNRITDNGSATEKAGNYGLSSYNVTQDLNYLTREINNSSRSEHNSGTYASSPSYAPAITPAYLTLPASPPTKWGPNTTTAVLSNGFNKTIPVKNESFGQSQDDASILDGNSSINSKPEEDKDSHIPVTALTSIPEMNKLLLQNHASYHSMRPRWSSAVDQELLQARSELENAPIVKNDPDLYAPIFRNISMFKRSYELMEETLKVYVYKEGAKPILHLPYLAGIYASEGWFMRLMEASKQFVTKDPEKAQLFYLPFSSRMLEETLYVQNSHSHKNLIHYLNNYVDMIARKHHFWNRTGGSDHFLVACHDWAPAETRDRMAKCIRALCNADVKEGFVLGKDVSLPETYVRNSQKPTRDVGGKPASKRTTLAFFAGGMHGYVRPMLLQHWENKDPDMKIFGIMPKSTGNRNYIQYMKSSKYCICAKGYEVNSPRVVEAIFYECVPVIISDNPIF